MLLKISKDKIWEMRLHLYTMYTMVPVPFVVCTYFKDGLEQWLDVLIGCFHDKKITA